MTENEPERVKLTLQKTDRLKTKHDFDELKERGRRWKAPFFTVLILSSPLVTDKQFGVICSRKFHKRAVVRNRARRLVRESFRLTKPDLKPCRILVIPRREIFDASMQEVRTQLSGILTKAGLLTSSPT